jgi:crossover junction endodeoxyribonuclease RuvC
MLPKRSERAADGALILGLDPGLAITGYGLVSVSSTGDPALVEYGTITTPAEQPLPDRLLTIDQELGALIARHRPEAVAVEELFFWRNVTTALIVGQARGVAILGAARAGLPVYEYKPMAVKQAITGYGKAPKSQVQEMVRLLLNLDEIPRPDDAADAIAVAICHLYNIRLASLLDSQGA